MAWYSAGTVTATNGSATVTGVGTLFLGNVRVGDGIAIAGSTSLHEVTGVSSDTQLTIAPVYPGTTGGSKTYRVAPVLGYDKDLSDAFNDIRLTWGGQLSSLKSWATAATAAIARTDLGLGSAATRTALGTTGSLYSRDSILGTVSQSSGVPTGAIIERGSNANGNYVRYADGTQICTAAWTMDSATSFGTGTATDPYRTSVKTINWAATFSAAPVASAIPTRTGTGLARIGYVSGESVSTTQLVNFQVTAVTNDVAPTVYIQAIGRWF